MRIIQAPDTTESYDAVVRLRRGAQEWLAATGADQWVNDWPDTETMLAGFATALRNGETWLAIDDEDHVIGAVTLNSHTAANLWSDEEIESALFVHRLTIDRAIAGHGVGTALLDFADHLASERGKQWLRLDAWTTNAALHRYYLRQGFQLVRIVNGHHTPSAACFERQVRTLADA